MWLIFAQNLRTFPASAEEQSLKFPIKVVNKTAASAAQFAKCILLSCLFTYNRSSQLREQKLKLHKAYLTS